MNGYKDSFKLPARLRSHTGAKVEKTLTFLIFPVAIVVAEWIITYSSPQVGMIIYASILVILLLHSYLERGVPERKLLFSLALAPLIRIIDLAIPLGSFYQFYRHVIISIPMVIAVVAVMRVLNFGAGNVGLTLRRVPLQVAVAITGIPLGLLGYLILKPQSLIIGLTWGDMILPGIAFILCIGFVEELIFRGVMQHASREVLGKWGILYISLIFGILSMGQLSALNMAFMFGVALFFSWAVNKTGSLLGVSLAHGLMSLAVYLVAPWIVM